MGGGGVPSEKGDSNPGGNYALPPNYSTESHFILIYFLIYLLIDVLICEHVNVYVYMYILSVVISAHKWSTTHRVLKSHRSKMSIIYMLSWKQCVLPVITRMALWQLMHLDTWCTDAHDAHGHMMLMMYIYTSYIYICMTYMWCIWYMYMIYDF